MGQTNKISDDTVKTIVDKGPPIVEGRTNIPHFKPAIPIVRERMYLDSGLWRQKNRKIIKTYLSQSEVIKDRRLQKKIQQRAEKLLHTNMALKSSINRLTEARFKAAMEIECPQNLKDHRLYDILKSQIDTYGVKEIAPLILDFNRVCANQSLKSEINQLYRDNTALAREYTAMVYKTVGHISLEAHIYSPDRFHHPAGPTAAIVFFHGGGWSEGKPQWGYRMCKHFAGLGITAVSIEYRIRDRHGVTPLESIADAKSALRWVRRNAENLNIDPKRIAAGGFSAGAHLAACTTFINRFHEPSENLNISPDPNALVLWSPVVNATCDKWFIEILNGGASPEECSPSYHVRPGLPPTIICHGRNDTLSPFRTAQQFQGMMKEAGNHCELHSYEEGGHFIFKQNREQIMEVTDRFLDSIGYTRPIKY